MQSISQVSVIAGGWSFSKVPHDLVPGYIIAVNDSAFHLRRRPDEIVSMDRLWAEFRWSWLREQRITTHLRRACMKNIDYNQSDVWLDVFECDHETAEFVSDDYGEPWFSLYPGKLNGTNSGSCALNRAFMLKPKELYLLGFDMQNGPKGELHWHPPYPWSDRWKTPPKKFITWAREFDLIAQQFESIGTRVWNVSDRSQIGVFSTLSVDQLRPKKVDPRFSGLELRP